jgi:hypothetical protein
MENKISRLLAALPLLLVFASSAHADDFSVTLNPGSVPGDYYGTLNLSFNTSDWNGTNWSFAGSTGWDQTFTVNSFFQVNVDLQTLSEDPGELFAYGALGISGPAFSPINVIGGGPGGSFNPGVSSSGTSQTSGSSFGFIGTSPYVVNAGFNLPMTWNGSSADWTGTWYVEWSDPPIGGAPVPDEAPGVLGWLAVAVGMIATGWTLKKSRTRNSAARAGAF